MAGPSLPGRVGSSDIRFYLEKIASGQTTLRAEMKQNEDTIRLEDYTGRNKRIMFIRDKMRTTRERKQLQNRQKKSTRNNET